MNVYYVIPSPFERSFLSNFSVYRRWSNKYYLKLLHRENLGDWKMSRLSEADVEKSCKPKDAATEGFCFQQTMIRVKVGIHRHAFMQSFGQNLCCINKPN